MDRFINYFWWFFVVFGSTYILCAVFDTIVRADHIYVEDQYYEPRPIIRNKVGVCKNNKQTYTVPAWYERFVHEGNRVGVCTPNHICRFELVPPGGKWYSFFRWHERERQCWD